MTLDEMKNLLCEDLSREYMHWNFYLEASVRIQGLYRNSLQDFLWEQAESEMNHIREFSKLLVGLNAGISISKIPSFLRATDAKEILTFALEMEEEVVKNYAYRIEQCALLDDKVNAKYIEIFLEEQLLHSRQDADDIREMLKGL